MNASTIRLLVLAAFLLTLLPSQARAAWIERTGDETHLWDDGGYSLVVARVHGVAEATDHRDLGTHRAALEPIATLAGHFDVTENAILEVRFTCGQQETSITAVPAKGDTVLAVLYLSGTDWYVVRDICDFMPGKSSLVVVSGLDDKQVMETILKLREACHPDEAKLTEKPKTPTTRNAEDKAH